MLQQRTHRQRDVLILFVFPGVALVKLVQMLQTPPPPALPRPVVVIGRGARGRVHVGRGGVHVVVVVVRVPPDARQLVRRGPGLGAEVVFVRCGVLVRVVMQRVRGQRVGVGPQVVGRRGAGSAAAEGDGVETPGHGERRAEDPGHQLVGGVAVDGRAGGVAVVIPSDVVCGSQRGRGGVRHSITAFPFLFAMGI